MRTDMERTILMAAMLFDVALVGGFALLYPRIARKGLLFGVYVGEARSRSDQAGTITRGWYRAVVASIVAALAVAGILAATDGPPLRILGPTLLLLAALFAAYLRAYVRARALASPAESHVAAAPIVAAAGPGLALPVAALALGIACGISSIAFTASHYGALPERMPTHFNIRGVPDGWSARGFGSVMILPIMTLVMGVVVGGAAVLTARAKRAVRLDDGGRSLAAQDRFRGALTTYLSVLAILMVAMITTLSFSSVEVALGRTTVLTWAVPVLGLGLVVLAVGGALTLAIRYGQGGARLEGPAADAALTDGLADNRLWKLGVFYVNAEDPSWLVEHRFGFGYTLNFGNPRAVVAMAAAMAAIIGLAAWAILAS